MKTRMLVCYSLSVLLLLLCLPAKAQVATGFPPFNHIATVPGGPETIDPLTLNLHWTFPIFSKPGRGIPISYSLPYDSSVWYPVWGSNGHYWTPSPNWGWGFLNTQMTGFVQMNFRGEQVCHTNPSAQFWTWTLVYQDPSGTQHPVGYYYTNGGYCNGQWPAYPAGSWCSCGSASDGSGFVLQSFSPSTGGTIITPSGDTLTQVPEAVNYSGQQPPITTSPTITDSNGNVINISSSGVITDSLGANALSIAGSGTPSSPYTFTYSAPSTGAAETYKVKYASYNIRTNFGCSGIGEYASNGISLVSEIDLPDATKYLFSYEPTPGHSGNVTGRIASVTLPTGGSISYSYAGYPNNGINCSDGSTSGFQRTSPGGGSLSYSHTGPPQYYTYPTATTYTEPYVGSAAYAYNGYGESEQDFDSGNNLLRTVLNCQNSLAPTPGNPPVCSSGTPPNYNERSSYVYWPNGLVARTDTFYQMNVPNTPDAYLPAEVDEYDYGNGAPGPLLRKTLTTYATNLGNIVDKPATTTIQDGSGNTVAQTTFNYDQTAVVATSGVPQHVAVSTPRGNLTSVTKMVQGSNTATSTSTYYDTGEVQFAYDFNNNKTTFGYVSTHNTPGPVSVTNALSQTASTTYDVYTGIATSTTDPNNQTTNYAYDFMSRPTQVTYPDGGQTTKCYTDTGGPTCTAGPAPFEAVTTQKINSSQNITTTAVLDGLGRDIEDQLNSDPAGTDYADHLPEGGFSQHASWNPYRTGSDPTYGVTTSTVDILGRTVQVLRPDYSSVNISYSGPCATVADEAGKKRQSCDDALGRLMSVTEDPSGLGYVTNYTYDALDNLLSVTQNGSRQRTFTYDALSRLLTATNPESGTVCYGTLSGSSCQNNGYDADGNLLYKTDARGVTITYSYDALNRLTQKSYSNGQPTVQYSYDAATGHGFAVGRLTHATNGANAAFDPVYDKMGRITGTSYCIPSDCSYAKTTSAVYDLAGDVTSYTNAAGVTISRTYNTAGQVTQVTSSLADAQHPATLATYTYGPTGAVTSLAYGNGLTSTSVFNNRLQLCRQDVNSSGTALNTCTDSTPGGSLLDYTYTWPTSTTGNNGTLSGWSATGQQSFNRAFGYDSLNRLVGMTDSGTSASCRGLTWTYDAWGNRLTQTPTAGTCGSWNVTYNANNQMSTYVYDPAGNLTNDGAHAYTYDAENNIIAVDGGATASYAYDAFGGRVSKTVSGVETDYLVDPAGNSYSLYGAGCGASCWAREYVGGLAEYANGTTYFKQADRLGSTRLMTGMNQSIYDSMDYTPFGEQMAGSTGTVDKFTSYERDSESNLDYATARYYGSSLGRFLSPDPANAGAALGDPQSWNAYAYVDDDPMDLVDPSGMGICDTLGSEGCTLAIAQCQSSGGGSSCANYYSSLHCSIQGMPTNCGTVYSALHNQSGMVCPGGDCSLIRTGPDGNWQVLVGRKDIPNGMKCNLRDVCKETFRTTAVWADVRVETPSDSMIWWENFARNFGLNFVSPSFYKSEMDEGGCLNVFAEGAEQADLLAKVMPLPGPVGPEDAIQVASATMAARYAAQQGLTVPLRSSVVRGMLESGETAAGAVGPALFDLQAGFGVSKEISAAANGTCH